MTSVRGHEIKYVNGRWLFADTQEPTTNTRPCGFCGEFATLEGHDSCLGTLPDVRNACCGHGQTRDAYIQFTDGVCVRGEAAITFFKEQR